MSTASHSNNGNALSAKKIFSGTIFFEIPYLRRTYVWEEKAWEYFLEYMEAVKDKKYLIGSIVLKELPKNGFETWYSVVDGQQRLTTFLLFARALCEINIKNFDLIDFYSDSKKDPILHHNNVDDKAIFNIILSIEHSDLDENIKKTYIENKNKVLECYNYFLNNSARLKKIDFKNLLECLFFDCIHLTNKQDKEILFDPMSSLGAPIATSDLIKNELYKKGKHSEERLQEFYKKTWKETFENEDSDYWNKEIAKEPNKQTNLTMLLNSYLKFFESTLNIKTFNKADYKKHAGLFEQYKYLVNNDNIVHDREKFIIEIMQYAEEYKEHINHKYEQNMKDSNSSIQRLNAVIFSTKATSIIPYALYILKTVTNKTEQKKIFELLESFLMRLFVVDFSVKNYDEYFFETINSNWNSYKTIQELIYNKEFDEIIKMPNDTLFKNGFENKKFETFQARAILYFLECHATAKNSVNPPIQLKPNTTLEHVMPKKWQENWKDNLPNKKEAEEERDEIIHRLGNQILLPKKLNGDLGNASWKDKKEGNTKSGTVVEGLNKCCSALETFKDYLEKDDWDEDVIKERDAELLKIAKDLWEYKPPA